MCLESLTPTPTGKIKVFSTQNSNIQKMYDILVDTISFHHFLSVVIKFQPYGNSKIKGPITCNCMLETIVCFVFIQFPFKNIINLLSNDLYPLTNGDQNAQKA